MAKKDSGGSQPSYDAAASAAAQGQANKDAVYESARVNQINQVTPYGTTTYTGEIGSPNRTQTLTLPPEVQRILSGQQQIGGQLTDFARQFVPRVAQGLQDPFNTANIGVDRPVANEAERSRIEAALLGRLEPQFARDEERLTNRLANQGITQGSEAYQGAMGDMNRARTDARLATIGQAGNEYARDFNMQNQSYQQALSDALLNRTQGLNEVSALIQGAPAMQMPQAPQTAQYQVAPVDVMGANQFGTQVAMNNYNQRLGQQNAMMGGLAGLGSAAILASDRRVKEDIRRVGTTDGGLPVYTFRYIGHSTTHMGVMAQEVEEVIPSAVFEIGGVKHVDYAQVM